MACFAALLALLFLAVSAQADEIEPEPETEVAPIVESEPEPEPEPEPETELVEETRIEDEGYARDGFYAGLNMSGTWYTEVKEDVKDRLEALGYSFALEIEKPLGLGVRTGYRFHPHFAAEAQFQWYSKAAVEVDVIQNKLDGIKLETLSFTGNLKTYLLTGRVQPFLLTGIGVMHLNADDKVNFGIKTSGDAFMARLGGGLDFYVTEKFGFVVDGGYLLPTGTLSDLKQVIWSAGLQYRF